MNAKLVKRNRKFLSDQWRALEKLFRKPSKNNIVKRMGVVR